jgi:cysteine synthase A
MTDTIPAIYRRLIRPTPLTLVRLGEDQPLIACKLDFLNPSGSTKDRIAAYILGKAVEQRRLAPGRLVVEASSGSTSIAMSMVCAHLGLKFAAVMPAGVSSERSMMIRAYGGRVIFTDAARGMAGAMEEARRLGEEENAFCPAQFENPDNIEAHCAGTAAEIITQMPDAGLEKLHAVVSGVGTGGTLVGLFRGLSQRGQTLRPVAAYPIKSSGMLARSGCFTEAECSSFSSRIPGVVDCLSKLYRPKELPGLMEISIADDLAIETTRSLIRLGFPVGPSSGLNYAAAVEAAKRIGPGANVVTVFPDRMERYFSTELFSGLASNA